MKKVLSTLILIILAISCGSDKRLVVTDYNQSCTLDENCVIVLVGEICDCSCEAGAINEIELEEYEKDKSRIDCSSASDCERKVCGICMVHQEYTAICTDNVCIAVPNED